MLEVVRLAFVVVGLAIWYLTQYLIGQRPPLDPDQSEKASSLLSRHDALFRLTGRLNRGLNENPLQANALLIASSAVMDMLGLFLLGSSIFGPSIRPFLGLLILFGSRQICQTLTALPPPVGMIWRYPGFPSLLVTYGVSNDLFFSGHTAMAVYGAVELARLGTTWVPVAVFIVVFEILAVLVLRAHYTMDVLAGLVMALYVASLATWLSPPCDQALLTLVGRR